MDKRQIKIYIKNILAVLIFCLLKAVFGIKLKPNTYKKLLIVNFGQIGDLTITSIIFDNLEENNLKDISILVDERFYNFFKYLAPSGDIVAINLKRYNNNILYRLITIFKLRKTYYQSVINLNSFNRIMTDEIVLLQNAGEYYCLENKWESLKPLFRNYMVSKYTKVLGKSSVNEYIRHFEVFEKFFNKKINFKPYSKKEKLANNISFDKFIVISPTTSQKITAWEINNFISLINKLALSFNIIVVGDKYIKELDIINSSRFINLSGKTTINEVISIIQNTKLYIGNDSGLTHIALKYGIPLICILGGGAFNKYFPIFESERTKFIYNKLDCFNCDWYCKYKEPKCLTQITVDEVYKESLNMLNKFYV